MGNTTEETKEKQQEKKTAKDKDDKKLPYKFKWLNVDDITTNGGKLRSNVEIEQLSKAIKKQGVIQPIIVKEGKKKHVLIDGERRWEAAKEVGQENIMALVVPSDTNALEMAIILNMQREDLNPIDEAEALQRLKKSYEKKEGKKCTEEDLAKITRLGRSTISENLSLNKLPDEIKEECRTSNDYPKNLLINIAKGKKTEEEMLALWKKEKRRREANKKREEKKTEDKNNPKGNNPPNPHGFNSKTNYPSPEKDFSIVFQCKKGETKSIKAESLETVFNNIIDALRMKYKVRLKPIEEK